MKVKDIAWLAGLLEGEGSFGMNKTSPCIQLAMTDKDAVDRAAALLGVDTHQYVYQPKGKESYKPVFSCKAHGTKAVQWMMTLYTLMCDRRKAKITEIIKAWRQSPAFPRSSRGTHGMALCHPDKHRCGYGLCRTCYMRKYRENQAKVKRLLPKSTVNVSPLPSVNPVP